MGLCHLARLIGPYTAGHEANFKQSDWYCMRTVCHIKNNLTRFL
ncbi:hypothetical protein AQUSIP_08450 [Aquicella siphonis]|uniref:Uncharacterized protein n=1 Tax=Aquicella siphonis TaxID=254247 RepID=A0A5E4PFZ7_9COXI|nr:hypothetical protein AQUSIP_08450 [Aquicella siphonis]